MYDGASVSLSREIFRQALELEAKIEAIKELGHAQRREVGKIKKYDGKEKEDAFQNVEHEVGSAPILALPEGTEDFVVYYDGIS
ncbi:hypothetical protein Tco_1180903 [Tanacetum coccineum]